MRSFKLVLETPDGSKVWINIPHILKMEKNREGQYFIWLVDGEMFPIDHSPASFIENSFEGR